MPECGSQVVLCDLPIRFDTWRGCTHGCRYCFARAKRPDLAAVRPGESVAALRRFIVGGRSQETCWCSWRIPLHWGGMSDPFQPAERPAGRSLECLQLLAETGYPVVISTKGALVAERPYRERLQRCNVCLQVSMVAPQFDRLEPGAPPFAARLRLVRRLAPCVPRLIVRIQPYVPAVLCQVLAVLPRYAAAGVHGVTIEGLKRKRAGPGSVKVGGDWCLPADRLKSDFLAIRARCHQLGLRFYCAENRLRRLSDDRCCCGVTGLPGFRPNRANLNGLVFGRRLRFTARMRQVGTAGVFKALAHDAVSTPALRSLSYADVMSMFAALPGFRMAVGLPPNGRRSTLARDIP